MSTDLPRPQKEIPNELRDLFPGFEIKHHLDTLYFNAAYCVNAKTHPNSKEFILFPIYVGGERPSTDKLRCILRPKFTRFPSGLYEVNLGKRLNSNDFPGLEYLVIPANVVNLSSVITAENYIPGEVLPSKIEMALTLLEEIPTIKEEVSKYYDDPLEAFAIDLRTFELTLLI